MHMAPEWTLIPRITHHRQKTHHAYRNTRVTLDLGGIAKNVRSKRNIADADVFCVFYFSSNMFSLQIAKVTLVSAGAGRPYIYICVSIYVQTHRYVRVYIYINICMYICIYLYIYIYISTSKSTYLYLYLYLCLYLYLHMHIYACDICMRNFFLTGAGKLSLGQGSLRRQSGRRRPRAE